MSKYTKQDIIRIVEEEDVEFIRLQFTDMFGTLKNVAITSSQLEKALNNECMFDGSSIEGFVRIEESDMYLYPDLDTFVIFPWRPQQGKVARIICDIYTADRKPFEGDPRYALKKAVADAESMGYRFDVGPECEFFLFNQLAVVFGILQIILEKDFYYAWMGLIFATAVVVCGIYMKIQNDLLEIQVAERSQNRAIVLLNKVKLKYINVANAVDYACEKYHVKSAGELENQWQYYLEAVKERQKYQRTNEDLEYFNGRLVRMLSNYQLYDAHVWVTQAVALVDPKEMVEIKHGLIGRRQKLRARIENNLSQVNEQKEEAEQLLDKVGSMRPQMEKILNAVDKINEGD